ncbi:unnamed protein product [Prorocentrum cordatum]|uniref:Uncharacterized protein n=1 Tax=Prorocentrum cordatum TaxID=2364126 RepID=A0ABN9PAH5_9DINO|nr:unnamed protein product [Polarella glacialis]
MAAGRGESAALARARTPPGRGAPGRAGAVPGATTQWGAAGVLLRPASGRGPLPRRDRARPRQGCRGPGAEPEAAAGAGGARLEPVEGYAGHGRLPGRSPPRRARPGPASPAPAVPSRRPRDSGSPLSRPSTPSCSDDREVWNDGRGKYKGCGYRYPLRSEQDQSAQGRGFPRFRRSKAPARSSESCRVCAASSCPSRSKLLEDSQTLTAKLLSPLIQQELRRLEESRWLGTPSRGLGSTEPELLKGQAASQPSEKTRRHKHIQPSELHADLPDRRWSPSRARGAMPVPPSLPSRRCSSGRRRDPAPTRGAPPTPTRPAPRPSGGRRAPGGESGPAAGGPGEPALRRRSPGPALADRRFALLFCRLSFAGSAPVVRIHV